MRKIIDKYEGYFEDLITLYDITEGPRTLRVVVNEIGAAGEGPEVGAVVEIIGGDKNDDYIINKVFEALKDDFEEAGTDYTTDYNCFINCRLFASFTTYGSPDDIETILKTVEKILLEEV